MYGIDKFKVVVPIPRVCLITISIMVCCCQFFNIFFRMAHLLCVLYNDIDNRRGNTRIINILNCHRIKVFFFFLILLDRALRRQRAQNAIGPVDKGGAASSLDLNITGLFGGHRELITTAAVPQSRLSTMILIDDD